jgi:hypothetical protein
MKCTRCRDTYWIFARRMMTVHGAATKLAERIGEGVRTRDGKMVFVGAEACARDFGKKRQWDNWTRGCSDVEYVAIAKVEIEVGKDYCDRYSQ